MPIRLPIVSKFDDRGVLDAKSALKGLSDASMVASGLIVAAFAGIAIGIGKISIDSVKIASHYEETASAIRYAFGDAADSLINFAKTAPDVLGMTQTQFLEAAKTFGLFGDAAGLAGQDNVAFSEQLTTLAADLASFNDTSVDDAIGALGAALRGENEPIRRYGVLLDDATLKAKAMEMGIYDGTDALTPQQKVLAAHAAILEQTSMQQGDFARTQDGLAGSTKTLQANFEDLQLKLGEKLIPVFDNLVDKMLEFVNSHGPQIQTTIDNVAGAVGWLVEAFIGFSDWYGDNTDLANSIATALAIIGTAIVVATGIIWAFNIALYANPIGLIIAGIVISLGIMIAIVLVVASHWKEFTTGMAIMWDAFTYGIGVAWAVVANGVIDGINFVIDGFNKLLDVWNTIAGTDFHVNLVGRVDMPKVPGSLVNGNGSVGAYRPGGMKLAAGGIVMPRPGGTLATIGEAGQAEAVIPLDRLDGMMGNRGGAANYVVNVNGGLATSADIGRAVIEAIKRYERTSGPVFVGA